MVQLRASLTCIILFLFLLASSLISVHSGNHGIPAVDEENQVRESHHEQQRKTWMNHGSFRGPRKSLINPTMELPFQAREFPV
ncbi:putative Transmembrane protein [Quillaja saponaria]|uniref:Transmembrane protein n=1 Tax=Quillaja saponaria TaxID=32244 RepID=A0AAD7KQ03_QUISA|nr:putative Transmembrane protein [Quillaja saponaria]